MTIADPDVSVESIVAKETASSVAKKSCRPRGPPSPPWSSPSCGRSRPLDC